MDKCCGPFKRGRPAKAVNPKQQCFADCCGNLCPPEDCCEEVKVTYRCGCECDCTYQGHKIGMFRLKKKRSKNTKVPTFSKKVLEENGFTFAAATVPTPTGSSSSSSSSCNCDDVVVGLTTDACCLYLSPTAIEAVGEGKVTAKMTVTDRGANCEPTVFLNGKASVEVAVKDGDQISVEVRSANGCECCEVQRDCVVQSTGLWVRKSNKEKGTLVMDKRELVERAKSIARRVKKRRG